MKKTFTLFSLLLFAIIFTTAQSIQVKGTVRDADSKDPLGGVNVRIEKARAVTDESGKFTLTVAIAGDHDMVVSSIGYKSDKRKVTLKADEPLQLEIVLKSNTLEITTVETVSQYKKNTAKETVSTQVIGVDQIKNTNAMDLGEVLSKSPGVLVQDGQISIRSASTYSYGVGARTMVLEDGLPLVSADLGEAQINMATLSNVKQVEVVKGASSVVYGSGALNGVVNLISQWPTDNDPKTSIDVNTGVYDRPRLKYQQWYEAPPFFTNININHQRRIKNFQFIIAGNITAEKSYLQFNDQYRMQTAFKLRYLHPKIEGLNFGINGSIQYERSERFFISKDLDSNIFIRGKGSDDRYIRTRIDPFVSYHNAKGHRVTLNIRYLNFFRKGNGTDPDAVDNQIIVFPQYQYNWKSMLVFTTGIPFDVASSRSNLYSGNDLTFHAAAYAQLEFDYKFLSVQGGLRYEASGVDTTVVKNLAPIFRAGINLQAAKATFFRASWGQGYRVPSIGEKYIAQQFTSSIVIIPNEDLQLERNWNMELGFWQGFKIGHWMGYFDAAFFWQQSKNFIEYEVGTYNNQYNNGQKIFPDSLEFPIAGSGRLLGLKPLNITNTRVAGYEIAIQGAGNIGPVGVKLLAGYTYTWPGQQLGPDSTKYSTSQFIKDMFYYNFRRVEGDATSKILDAIPRHLVRADIELSYSRFYLGTTISYVSDPEKIPFLFTAASIFIFHNSNALIDYSQQHVKGDVVVDIRAGAKVNDHVRLGFICKNLADRLYSLRPGKPEPLRNFTFQFRYTF
ncbi:MAG: hypothetical protein JWO06_2621 [Bacteroidota bacterium]|nr:hypothetical protein [Bacteroidota bacterium]